MYKKYFKLNVIILFAVIAIFLPRLCVAAIVSDNDGPAFVTKAEFESLKENFAKQVDNYSDSIDKKIDGAIASYLAGIRLETKSQLESLLNKINDACTDSYISSGTEKKYGYRCMAKSYTPPATQKPVGAIVNLFAGNFLAGNYMSDANWSYGWIRLGMSGDTRTGLYDVDVPSTGRKNGKYLIFNSYGGKYYPMNTFSDVLYRYYVTGNTAAQDLTGTPIQGTTNANVIWTFPTFRILETYWTMKFDTAVAQWVDNVSGGAPGSYDTFKVLYGASYESNDTIDVVPIIGSISNATKVYGLLNDNIAKMSEQETSYNWTTYGQQIWAGWTQEGSSASTWRRDTFLNAISKPIITFYFNCHPYETVNLSNLIDYNATINNENTNVAIYGGLPIFKVPSAGEVIMKIKFKSDAGNDVVVGLQKKQFSNNAKYDIDSSLGLRDENDVKYTSNQFEHDKEYTFVMDVNKDDVVWIKTYDATSDVAFTGAVTNGITLITS